MDSSRLIQENEIVNSLLLDNESWFSDISSCEICPWNNDVQKEKVGRHASTLQKKIVKYNDIKPNNKLPNIKHYKLKKNSSPKGSNRNQNALRKGILKDSQNKENKLYSNLNETIKTNRDPETCRDAIKLNQTNQNFQVDKENNSIISQLKDYKGKVQNLTNQREDFSEILTSSQLRYKMLDKTDKSVMTKNSDNILNSTSVNYRKKDNRKMQESFKRVPVKFRSGSISDHYVKINERSNNSKILKNNEEIKKFQGILNEIINTRQIPTIPHSQIKRTLNRF